MHGETTIQRQGGKMPVKRLIAAAVALVALVIALSWLAQYLWFEALGYGAVFWRLRELSVGTWLVATTAAGAYLAWNTRALYRNLGGARHHGHPLPPRLLAYAVAGIAALAAGFVFEGRWGTVLRFLWARPFGVSDPILGRDVGFYLFTLPMLSLLQHALALAAFVVTAVLASLYHDARLLRLDWHTGVAGARGAVTHVSRNLALFAFAVAAGFFLDRYALLQNPTGAVYGANWTDVHVSLPALWVAAVASAVAGVALLRPRLLQRRGVAVKALGAYLLVTLSGLLVAPWLVQSFYVEPNELELEKPYLEHNIAFTRKAFGLDHVDVRDYGDVHRLTPADLERNHPTVENIRLWDWGPIGRTFRQLQQIRSYYQFYDVDADRYRFEGRYRQVLLSARELSGSLPGRSDTWLNRHLQFTHGYGLAMSLAAEKTAEGTPVFVIKDLPPHSAPGLQVTQPAIYYGENMPGFSIVDTAVREFDYPRGDDNAYTRYAGHGGVLLDSYWKRLLYAWHESDFNILLTSYITHASRIQFWRDVQERISHIAPFLILDHDPYLVLDKGRLYWIQDAYTTASGYPYAQPYGQVSYIRNSVKVVVDAYQGDVRFYVVDPHDPVLATYRAALPGLFRPLSDMPPGLRAHLRYPEDLFSLQVAVYNTYHMTSPQVFYNREDVWSVPNEKYGGRQVQMKPYYALVKLPGEERLQFLLITPVTPRNRDNMIAWLAARSDYPRDSHLVAYKLPKERLVLGPIQIEAMIDQDTTISQQLSLWDQRGSRVIRGNLLVIPLARSFLYVEPVYLVAEGTDIPELKRVIVSDGRRLAMEPTLPAALAAVFGAGQAAAAAQTAAPQPAAPQPAQLQSLRRARDALDAAQKAMRKGDWAAFGQAMKGLDAALAH